METTSGKSYIEQRKRICENASIGNKINKGSIKIEPSSAMNPLSNEILSKARVTNLNSSICLFKAH